MPARTTCARPARRRTFPPTAGTSCSLLAPLVCDGNGNCVQCVAPEDRPGVDTECSQRSCVEDQCGTISTTQGTAVADQTLGDCKKAVCDGAGGIENVAEPTVR